MRPIHVALLNSGELSRAAFLQMQKDFKREFDRAEDMCQTIERLPEGDIKGAIDVLQQTWDAIREANGKAPAEGVLVAWAPALRLLLDCMSALEEALQEREESQSAEYARLLMQVDEFRQTGVFPVPS